MPGSVGSWNGSCRQACGSPPPPVTPPVCKSESILLHGSLTRAISWEYLAWSLVVLLGQRKSRNGGDTDGSLVINVLVRVYDSSNVIVYLLYLLT